MEDWKVSKAIRFWGFTLTRLTICIKGTQIEMWVSWLVAQNVPRELATQFVLELLDEVKRVIDRL